ncbi:MAG TPA: AsmA-like C-terminal domain-containing protein [Devosiaceae bacterium]|nr:AsmA-like C-terminal domain-containing protein [Devosiaceae bacterium]
MHVEAAPQRKRRRRNRSGRALRGLLWALAILLTPLLVLYVVLLVRPIPLPFVRDQARAAVMASLPPSANLELGDMALALEGAAWPVLQFSPVTYTDRKSGAKIQMKALDVGFSPVRVLIGQPGATITMVAPHLQVNQDLLGPRLANLQIVNDPKTGGTIVRVQEGEDAFPTVGISAGGISVRGEMPSGQSSQLRSDNDWLIYNLEASEQSLADIVTQAKEGRFSRLTIKDAVMDMNDAVYGVFRQFTHISVEVSPGVDGRQVNGQFAATFNGQAMHGDFSRQVNDDGSSDLTSNITNMDFASFLPFINDPDSVMGVVGTGAVSIDVSFDPQGKVKGGVFHTDMTGMDLRINKDQFPIATSIAEIRWDPTKGEFSMDNAELKIGQSSAEVSGIFVLGLDEQYGPTVGMSIKAKDVDLRPGDLGVPDKPFDSMDFSGWSAPLYGALGIDQLDAVKGSAHIVTKGRIDMLRRGLGLDLHVKGAGVSADDLKRLWPYFLSKDSRDWFVKNVKAGRVESSDMQFSFPVGTIATKGDPDKPIPKNGMSIDVVGSGVKFALTDSMAPVGIEGNTRLQIRDSKLTVSGDGISVPTKSGDVGFATPALVLDSSNPDATVFEISGEIKSGIPALVALVRQQQPQAVDNPQLPIDLSALGGDADLNLVSTITLDRKGALKNLDYALNGSVANFASTAPIQGHQISGGSLSFTASQKGYQGTGQATVDGLPADLKVDGTADSPPTLLLSSTLDVKDLKGMGFDATNFLSGQVRFVAKPVADGSVQLAVDIKDAALTIKDLGISKDKGVPGTLEAAVKQDGDITEMSQIKLTFGDVDLEGSLDYDDKKGLQSAEFTTFALSPGDQAQVSLTPIRDGYALRLRGEQLDLKPMLQHFFGLGGGVGGPQATQFNQTLALDVDLKRALGFYKTVAYNLQLGITLKGTDIQKATLQAQLGNDRSVSVTTNPTPDGKVLTVAFNDFGSLLRFGGIYSRIEGGAGSLVMTTNNAQHVDYGNFEIGRFALVNESTAAAVLDKHEQSQALARENRINFKGGRVEFTRQADRVQITDGVVNGDSVGGTVHGFIYTDRRQYDLVGTYIPLFGLNSVFQKLPLFGPLLGGRDGEGLIGVTFAVRGPLDKPTFQINPASMLVPGAFRGLFEYRARGLPGDTPQTRPQATTQTSQ